MPYMHKLYIIIIITLYYWNHSDSLTFKRRHSTVVVKAIDHKYIMETSYRTFIISVST